MGHRTLGPIAFAGSLALSLSVGCTRQEDAFGQLIVLINSEVPVRSVSAVDGELDRVQVEVTQNNVVLLNRDWIFPSSTLTFPQTVALVNQGSGASEPLRFVVTASRDGSATFVQERQLLVPSDTIASTVMGFEWLCRGFASTVNNRASSGCPAGQTCRAGACVAVLPSADDVSPFAPSPACFDLQACFAGAQDITASLDATCALALASSDVASLGTLNVALEPVVGQGGVCDAGPTPRCLVGLPRGASSGFTAAEGKLQLPASVCQLLAGGDRIARVWLSRGCPSRPPAQPVCSPWIAP